MGTMYATIGQNRPTYLLADPNGADVIAIPCEPGNGTVLRGTLMYRKTSGLWAPAGSSDVITTNPFAVIDLDVDTDESMAVAEDARAYRAARLIDGKVLLSDGTAPTEAHKVILRTQGLVFNHMDGTAPVFENGRTTITYKANGGTGDDVMAYVAIGSTYTIAANSFTPPASKSFSKWNTKADGSGTDYASAASYTADADLVLYAVWTN